MVRIPSLVQDSGSLWNHVIFPHEIASSIIVCEKFFTPTIADCCGYLDQMKLPVDVVEKLLHVGSQTVNYGLHCRMAELQAPNLVKFYIEGHQLILRD